MARRHLRKDVKRLFREEASASLVPATFLVFGALDLVPVPTDIGYVYTTKWLDQNRARLSDRKFWALQLVNYFGWDAAWYLSLFLVTYFSGKNANQKLLLGVGLISSGAIATIVWRAMSGHGQVQRVLPTPPEAA
jgi:hypothetical protein